MAGNVENFQNLMNQGHSAAWDQMWEKAAGFYQKALEEFPDNPGALTSLAMSYYELNRFDDSLSYYIKAAQITPEDPIPAEKIARIQENQGAIPDAVRSYLKAADLYLKSKEVEKAIECWKRITTLKPDHLNARTRLAMIQERRGKKSEAVDEYLVTASIMQHQGDERRARQVIEYCLQLVPNQSNARNALALLNSNQMLPKPAGQRVDPRPVQMPPLKTSEQGHEVAPKRDPILEARQQALIQIATLLFEQADLTSDERPTKRRDLSDITSGTSLAGGNRIKDSKSLFYLGQAIDAQTHEDDNQTLIELEKALNAGLDHPSVHYLVGMIYAKKESNKILKHLQNSVTHPNFTMGSYLLLGQYYFALENYLDAAIAFMHALSIADSSTAPSEQTTELRQLYEPILEGLNHQADLHTLNNFCKNIQEALIRPDWQEHLDTYRKQIEQSESGQLMPIANLLLESSSHIIEGIAQVRNLAAQNKYYSALEEAFYAMDKAPTYLPLHILIGELLLQQGKTSEAVTKFTLVANLYNLRGEADHGIRMLDKVVQMAPMNLKIRNQLVDMLASQGQAVAAAEQLKNIADIHYQLAELDQARESYVEAIRLIQHARENRSLLVDLLYKKSDIDLQHLDLRQALQTFEQIRAIEPQDSKVRIKLIDLYFRLGQDNSAMTEMDGFITALQKNGKSQEIIPFLLDLLSEIPDKLEIRKRLADMHARFGDVPKAVEQLDVIADTLLNMGNREAALRILKSIISLNPENVSEYQQAYKHLSQK